MKKIRRLDIDNTGNYKRGFSGWIIRYKSIRAYKLQRIKRVDPKTPLFGVSRKAEREDIRAARRTRTERNKEYNSKRISVPVFRIFKEADWLVIGVCFFIIFSVVFMYNALRGNKVVSASTPEIGENIALITTLQKASVDEIEERVEQLNELETVVEDYDEDPRTRYMTLMSDSVVIGDSLTAGLTVYGWLSERQVFSEIGASIISGQSMFDQAAALHPKNAFFAFGMNDMGNYGGNEANFIERYNELLDSFAKESPNTKMYICSISVPTDYAIEGNSVIGNYQKFNEALKQMAAARGIPFVDSTSILIEHPEYYAGDGIHVSSDYYPLWLENMVRAISQYGLR